MVNEGEDFFRGGGESFLVDGRFAGGTAFDEVESETVAAWFSGKVGNFLCKFGEIWRIYVIY